MQTNTNAFIIDAGFDYLSLTTKPGLSCFHDCQDIWRHLLQSEENLGHKLEELKRGNYSGFACGSFFYGGREEDMFFDVSGPRSNHAIELMREVNFRGNVTRLDAQITIRQKEARAKTVQQLRKHRLARWEAGKTKDCQKINTWETPKAADTLYFGSPNSDSRIRVYNAASCHPDRYSGDAWRYEAQFRKRCTPQPWGWLRSSNSLSGAAKRIVVGKLQSLGIREQWHSGIPPIEPMSGTVKTSLERKMAWLAKGVSPSVAECWEAFGGTEVLEALGITAEMLANL